MPYDSNGVWSLTAGYLAVTGQVVSPTNHNPPLEDISANGLSAVMVRDGRAPATGNWDMGTFRLTNLGAPVNPADAVTKSYADGFSSTYSLITTNTAVTAADKGKWYRATSALTLAPGAAATLGVNFSFNVKNDSTGNVIIDPSNGTEKINGVDQLVVPPGQSAFVICDGSNYFGYISSSPLVGPQLQGYLFGLTATTNVGTPATNIDVAAGAVASSASPYYLIQLSASITKNTNNAFAVGTGNGSLDTGAIANSTYYGYVIQRSDTGVVDVLTSLSATSPTMPASYDLRSPAIFTFTRTAGVNSAPIMINSTGIQLGIALSLSSGTAVDFSNIPSNAKRVTLHFISLTFSGTSIPEIRLGTSSGIVSTGYTSDVVAVAAGTGQGSSTTGHLIIQSAISGNWSGQVVFDRMVGNTWKGTGMTRYAVGSITSHTSYNSLSSALTQVRLTTQAGTSTFTSGTAVLSWEF